MRSKTALGVHDERITGAFFFNGEKRFVGFGGAGAVQTFPGAALVVINGGQDVIAGDIVEKHGSGFAAARQANIEFRGSLCKRPGIEIGPAHIKTAKPGVGEFLRFLESIQGVARVSVFQLCFASN